MDENNEQQLDEIPEAFTHMCKNFNDLGRSLKVASELISRTVTEEDISRYLAVLLVGYVDQENRVDLSKKLANHLCGEFSIMVRKEIHDNTCKCEEC